MFARVFTVCRRNKTTFLLAQPIHIITLFISRRFLSRAKLILRYLAVKSQAHNSFSIIRGKNDGLFYDPFFSYPYENCISGGHKPSRFYWSIAFNHFLHILWFSNDTHGGTATWFSVSTFKGQRYLFSTLMTEPIYKSLIALYVSISCAGFS